MLTHRADKAHRIQLLQICKVFSLIIRNKLISFIVIGIFFSLLPKILFDWFTIDPHLRVGRAPWRYAAGQYFDLLCNSAFSMLIVLVSLSGAEKLNPPDDHNFIWIYGRFLLFNILTNVFFIFESSLSLINPALAHSAANFIGVFNPFFKVMSFALFGLFLPTLFEGVTFQIGIRKSYKYLSGYRFMASAAYILACALDFIPLPIIEIFHPPLLLSPSSDKNNLIILYAAAKSISAIFEIAWLIVVTSFYLLIRRQEEHDQESMVSLFD
jgi:hypothetical protein